MLHNITLTISSLMFPTVVPVKGDPQLGQLYWQVYSYCIEIKHGRNKWMENLFLETQWCTSFLKPLLDFPMVCGQNYNARAHMPLTTHTTSIQASRGRTGAGLHLLRQNYNAIVPALNAEQLRLPRDRIRHGLGFLAQTLETQHRDSRRFLKLIFMLLMQ